MAAIRAVKRKNTAKYLSKKLGIHERTVRRYIALPREDYESEAENRRKTAYNLHFKDGLKWRDVAEKMNTTEHAVKALAKRYKQIDQENRG
ncbi:TPA: HTH domain-containing protein [Klebsiella pneumoniae]|nr:HTH domain-containing protein [Klebsiella pneumoniae]EDB9947346.1 HTH domain-containing protein [Salmonella enterica subsp. enterica serovar Muenchen]EDQ5935807.1 HTH domain-containing protein [Salmonella enterica subsp. enterica serovar Emek]EHT9764857.1 HTH domain-containing protein [Salmonella enterica subsp. enterica serovar Orion]ELO8222865.1 HTH domain-containing protein [Salmonella enterica]MDF6195835.1 helix-turn-helix domain-containing protein [Escherichia coli]HCA4368687.1 HTH do